MTKVQRHYWKGWNTALDRLRGQVNEVPDHIPLMPGHEAVLDVVRFLIDGLYRDREEVASLTNAELCAKYGLARRTVQYWPRAAISPVGGGSWRLRGRWSLPAQFKAKCGSLIDKPNERSGHRNEVCLLRGMVSGGNHRNVALVDR